MARVSKTRFAILGFLSIEPMSGYDIMQEIKQTTNGFWSESDGQIYPTLEKLTEQGAVTCKQVQKSTGRTSKIYTITKKGKSELADWLMQEPEPDTIRSEFLLKLFFGANVPANVSREHIQGLRYKLKLRLMKFDKLIQELKADYADSAHLTYWLISINYALQIARAKLTWCDETITILSGEKS